MIPRWKVRRELNRLGQQLRTLPEALWEPRVTRQYDAAFPAQLKFTEGVVPGAAQVALVLIYPRLELPVTTVELIASLAKAGFAPLVVSNAALSDADRARLSSVAWRIVERPNLGHDFGGYRDGLRLLRHWGLTPDEVLILNDSVWLVDGNAAGLVLALRAVDADVAGAVLRDPSGAPFLESYCYLIPGRVLRHPQVIAWWNAMVLTSNKYKVIRQGERGHSSALRAAGFRLGAAWNESTLLKALDTASDLVVQATIRHAGWLFERDVSAARALLTDPGAAGNRAAALDLIRSALTRGQFYSLFPVAARGLCGYPFLKCSGDRVAVLWRRAYLSAITAGDLPLPDSDVYAALRARASSEASRVELA